MNALPRNIVIKEIIPKILPNNKMNKDNLVNHLESLRKSTVIMNIKKALTSHIAKIKYNDKPFGNSSMINRTINSVMKIGSVTLKNSKKPSKLYLFSGNESDLFRAPTQKMKDFHELINFAREQKHNYGYIDIDLILDLKSLTKYNGANNKIIASKIVKNSLQSLKNERNNLTLETIKNHFKMANNDVLIINASMFKVNNNKLKPWSPTNINKNIVNTFLKNI